MKVTNQIDSCDAPSKPSIRVKSHWMNSKLVEIWFDDENSRLVDARELKKAVDNATNN